MRLLLSVIIVSAALALTACSSAPNCDEPQIYESAQGGKRIEAPDDLDDLAVFKEMPIPDASPRPPREQGTGCLDKPPTLRIDDEEEAEEVEDEDEET